MGRVVKVDGAWITAAPSQAIMAMLGEAGHVAYFVGGCVRNSMLNHPVSDIDISTDAPPETVVNLAEVCGLRAIPTGIDHGTVTVVVEDIPHEVTTFRKDVATDGRRAVVAFSKDITEDALRRDFTMNALYADADGTVIDPLSGLSDLRSRRVRFIENAATRIKEDYLRILRFFRFHAWFGDPEAGLDPDGLAACAELADGIAQLSKERIGAEMIKLLAAPDPAPSVAAMRSAGVLAQVLPGADDKFLAPLVHLEAERAPSPVRRLAVLGGEDAAMSLRLPKSEAKQLGLLRDEMGAMSPSHELGYRHGVGTGYDVLLLRSVLSQTAVRDKDIDDLTKGEDAVFPVSASDLMPEYDGRALGQKLKELERAWIASAFQLTKADLLS
ncbi:MAG: CCA tRNA nucleotidyltransferase [Pseudomonadota bacterium]